ncbi:MAG: hypothetical protein R3E57_05415 [Porticoccaceae bacterium]
MTDMETMAGQSNGVSLGRWLMAIPGIGLLLLSLRPFLDFPVVGQWLLVAGAGYFALLYLFPRCWLLILPLITVSLDFATYTGRFLFNEYDLFFLITISYALISGRFDIGIIRRKWAFTLVAVYMAVVFSTFKAWSVFLFPPEATESNPYYLPEYGYRLVRGMLWALLITPLWVHLFKKDKQQTILWFLVGQCVAALMLGGIILWERGSLGVLLSGAAWYHIVNSVLDLSSAYRTTGIFSGMHTGGEIIDGVLLLLLPATLYGLVQGDRLWLKALALIAFCALAYSATVGFTRATYVSFFLSCSAFAVLFIFSRKLAGLHRQDIPYLHGLGVLMVGLVAAFLSFSRGGSFALAACSGLVFIAMAGVMMMRFHRLLSGACWLLGGVAMVTLAVKSHLDSRWIESSMMWAGVIAIAQICFFVMTIWLFLRLRHQNVFNNLMVMVLLIMLPAIFAMALGGYKIKERMTTAFEDLDTRMSHWQDVAASSSGGVMVDLIGNGTGTFPANYAYHFPDVVKKVGSFVVMNEGDKAYLRMGVGEDLAFGQRVSVTPSSEYKLKLLARADDKARLAVYVCERNLIFASEFRSNCNAKSIRFEDTEGLFKPFSLTVDSEEVGARHPWARWPTTVYFKNVSKQAVIEIDNVMFELDESNLLYNGDFSAGLDGWFFYNDFQHLPWHVKNIYVQSWYDNGWIGLVIFLTLGVCVALLPVFRPRLSPMYVVFSVGIIGIGVFGFFGSPLDSARVSWLFYFYLFAALLRPSDVDSSETLAQ